MFARVIVSQSTPDKVDEGVAYINETVIPGAKEISGLTGGYWMVDRSSGKFTTVTLWDGEASIAASRDAAERIRERAVQEISVQFVAVEEYEVIGQA